MKPFIDLRTWPDTSRHGDITLTLDANRIAPALPRVTDDDALAYVSYLDMTPAHVTFFDREENLRCLTDWMEKIKEQTHEPNPGWQHMTGPARRYMAISHHKDGDALAGEVSIYQPPMSMIARDEPPAICLGIWVLPSQRRQGRASQMIAAFTDLAAKSGVQNVCAETDFSLGYGASARALLQVGFTDMGAGPLTTSHPATLGEYEKVLRFMWQKDGTPTRWPFRPQPARQTLGYTP